MLLVPPIFYHVVNENWYPFEIFINIIRKTNSTTCFHLRQDLFLTLKPLESDQLPFLRCNRYLSKKKTVCIKFIISPKKGKTEDTGGLIIFIFLFSKFLEY